MSLNSDDFVVYDIQTFPLIVLNQAAIQPGYAAQWQAEMERLMACNCPFVVANNHLRVEETAEDRQQRGDWLIHQRKALSQVCKGMISIESDGERREPLEKIRQLFGMPHRVVDSLQAAQQQCAEWLS